VLLVSLEAVSPFYASAAEIGGVKESCSPIVCIVSQISWKTIPLVDTKLTRIFFIAQTILALGKFTTILDMCNFSEVKSPLFLAVYLLKMKKTG